MWSRTIILLVLGVIASVGAQVGPAARPDATRFLAETLVPEGQLDEPLAFAVARDGRVFIAERKGALKVYQPSLGTTKTVTAFKVFTDNEQGLIGVAVDPAFATNRWIYVQYADAAESAFLLRRLTLTAADDVVAGSERTLLRIPVDRAPTNHTGGGMTWDARGNLYLTVGNNTSNQNFMQTDERPGREVYDDQRTSANTNDLRGKILRIRPEVNGTYSIPAGNMFPPGTPNTRPEIFSMGHRNAWRVSIDSATGHVYWGEIGPDQAADSASTPRGYDEFNRATGPGFFGWPYFVGKNRPARFADYLTNKFTEAKDPKRPTNTSRNNTGLRDLPPAVPPILEYPFAESEEFPELGSGSRCAIGGPFFRRADFANAPRPWPAYYDGKWIVTDCVRGWVKALTLAADGNVQRVEEVFPNRGVAEPMDMKFGPEGDLYILDYGSVWYGKSPDSKLVRVKFQAGNRVPVAVAAADRRGGRTPLNVALNASGSRDFDGDALRYSWTLSAPGVPTRTVTGATPNVSLTARGLYTATLTVTDPAGASASDSVSITAGNEQPSVQVAVTGNIPGNTGFFVPGQPLSYRVQVTDPEDGSIEKDVDANRVVVSIDYLPEGFDVDGLRRQLDPADASTRFAAGRALVNGSDCRACHQPAVRTRGPSMQELADRYRPDEPTLDRLADKVRNGGNGVWGTETMPAHPTLSKQAARLMVRYFLGARSTTWRELPIAGTYTPAIPVDDDGRGALLFRAVYTDRGSSGAPALTSEHSVVFRSRSMSPLRADSRVGVEPASGRNASGAQAFRDGAIGFRRIDLTGVTQVGIAARATGGRTAQVGGKIEIRLGSPTGTLIGTLDVPVRGGGPAPAPADSLSPTADIGGPLDGVPGGPGRANTPGAAADGPAAAAGGRGVVPPGAAIAGAMPAGGAGGRGGTLPIYVRSPVAITATRGVHDVYLVFRNDTAAPSVPLMTIEDVMFSF